MTKLYKCNNYQVQTILSIINVKKCFCVFLRRKYQSKILSDGWTAVTKDKTLSAQYEHTIYINGDNVEILTESPNKAFYN